MPPLEEISRLLNFVFGKMLAKYINPSFVILFLPVANLNLRQSNFVEGSFSDKYFNPISVI